MHIDYRCSACHKAYEVIEENVGKRACECRGAPPQIKYDGSQGWRTFGEQQ